MEKTKRLILGEGEGVNEAGQIHKHVLQSDADVMYERNTDSISFELKELGVLTHDEHDRIVFKPGLYRSYNQVEFNPMDSSISRVFD